MCLHSDVRLPLKYNCSFDQFQKTAQYCLNYACSIYRNTFLACSLYALTYVHSSTVHLIAYPPKSCLQMISLAPREGAGKRFLNRDDKDVDLCLSCHSPRLAWFWSSRSWDKWKSLLRYDALISLKDMKWNVIYRYDYMCYCICNIIIVNSDRSIN